MTTIKDQYEVWTEAAYEYVRDSLRRNPTVGLRGREGVKQIEIGIPDTEDIARHPAGLPVIWITPTSDQPTRDGHYLRHEIRLEVHVFSPVPFQPPGQFVDGQKRHRQFAGRVYNEVLALRDGGQTQGHWRTLEPGGASIHEGAIGSESHATLHTMRPFTFTHERLFISGD